MLRIIGTFIGCFAALTIIILMIRTPLLTPAETCLKKPCTSVRSFMAVGMDGFDRLLEKLQPHLAEFRTQA